MPINFLNSFERQQYHNMPQDILEESLIQFFHISEKDIIFIKGFYSNTNRIAVAILIGIIRSLGYVPIDWKEKVPIEIFSFITKQLGYNNITCSILLEYGKREQTETEHLRQILIYVGFRKWQPLLDTPDFEEWLIEKGMEHDKERYLLNILCQKLYQEKILRPSIGTLEVLVAGIRELLAQETYNRLSFLWKDDFCEKLDHILEVDSKRKITLHRWFCSLPSGNKATDINQMLEKYEFLVNLGVKSWDMSCLSENRKKQLARFVRNNTNTDIKRIYYLKRYPMLICFLWESLLDITDIIMVMYADYWLRIMSKTKRSLDTLLLQTMKSKRQAINTLTQISKMVVDENIGNVELREHIYQTLSKVQIEEAIGAILNKEIKSISQFSFLTDYYSSMKQFSPRLLSNIEFKVAFTKDNFDTALDLVKSLQRNKRRKIPQDAPMNFMSTNWQKVVIQEGKINQQNYELCVLSTLKDRLQSGDIYLNLSRRFASLESLLISNAHWQENREEICSKLSLPDLHNRIEEKIEDLSSLLPELTKILSESSDVRLENGILVVPPLTAEDIPPRAKELQNQINARLPKVSLPEMIQEVDNWINYSSELISDQSARNPKHQNLKYAVLFANACNLSLADLARSSDLDYQSLWWVKNNYLSDENLKKANNLLVNFQHKQWISRYWGNGTLSSSDGQRFPTNGKIRNAKAIPKYFGYGQGVGVYTHTADQYPQFGSQVISVHERESTFTLNDILANETDLPLHEHTTDTHGYTDLNFALFDLVGKQFSPRIRDIKDQRLYKVTGKDIRNLNYPALKFTGVVNIDYLKKYADDMTRTAASLKSGSVTPSTLISKLQAYPRQNNLMYVLQSYGQLIKTIFICRYLLSKTLRKR
ncbi:Tn3 family transposase, partial [Chryseobacterium fistulae]|uniref:Tn3 family transposase n=1 Tax=Chryseobacterium fistulae TaxID=2675058 RepID=UPI00138997FB